MAEPSHIGPWRHPGEETSEYPGLMVHDGQVSGSIVVGSSRLALWAFSYQLVTEGWDAVEREYGPRIERSELAAFLTHLLSPRGDFGRLVLALADAERREAERDETWDGGSPWWNDPELAGPVAELLRSCLAVLEGP